MQRVLKGTTAQISVTFSLDGTPTDPSPATATIEILREDGTALVAAGTSTDRASVGVFTFNLLPAHTAQLDQLQARWTATLGGQAQTLTTRVEIVGGFHTSLAEIRKLRPLNDTVRYPTVDVLAARTAAEQALEDATGVAFVPRYVRERFNGDDRTDVRVRWRPSQVLAASVDGVALSAGELAELVLYNDGRIYRPSGWHCGRRNVELKYIHGYPSAPLRVARACRSLIRRDLVESPLDDRTTRVTSEGGTAVFATAEDGGFDIPEVNAVVERYSRPALLA